MKRYIGTYKDFINEDVIPGGLADSKKPEDFDPIKLADGIKVELEHTSDSNIAREIAMDHLTEDPNYYEKLKTIESHINETIKHENNKWNVYSKDGKKKLGSHSTKKDAISQLRAIEISKNK